MCGKFGPRLSRGVCQGGQGNGNEFPIGGGLFLSRSAWEHSPVKQVPCQVAVRKSVSVGRLFLALVAQLVADFLGLLAKFRRLGFTILQAQGFR